MLTLICPKSFSSEIKKILSYGRKVKGKFVKKCFLLNVFDRIFFNLRWLETVFAFPMQSIWKQKKLKLYLTDPDHILPQDQDNTTLLFFQRSIEKSVSMATLMSFQLGPQNRHIFNFFENRTVNFSKKWHTAFVFFVLFEGQI